MLRHGKAIVFFLVILTVVIGYYGWAQSREGEHTVWVALEDILPGVIITDSMIEAVRVDRPLVGLTRDDIVGAVAAVHIPEGAAISSGIGPPKEHTGSLVNIPVSLDMVGLVVPGDKVELVGVTHNGNSVHPLGEALVVAYLDRTGTVYRAGPLVQAPTVLVVEVESTKVVDILGCIATGKVYPVLGGVEIAPNDGE